MIHSFTEDRQGSREAIERTGQDGKRKKEDKEKPSDEGTSQISKTTKG